MKCSLSHYFLSSYNTNRYQYLDTYRKDRQRPAVFMPQLAELSNYEEGYAKLFNACSRFQNLPSVFIQMNITDNEDIDYVAGLVPFREWRCVLLDDMV